VWEWFCLSNIVAVLVFLSCVTYLLPFWVEHMRTGGGHFSVAQPAFIASAVGALGSLLYFFAFFGVAFVHQDVKEIMRGEDVARRAAQRRAAGGQNGPASSSAEGDADVVIVGMGIAGATLATVLARQGKRVVVLERCVGGGDGVRARRVGYQAPPNISPWSCPPLPSPPSPSPSPPSLPPSHSAKEPEDTIKGELLQPGGIRSLERMGLGACAKRAEVDGIRVDGYVCITPGAASRASDAAASAPAAGSSRSRMGIAPEDCVVLSYPLDDPHTTGEFLGVTPPNAGRVVTADTVASAPAGTVGTGLTEVCPVTGRDLNPHGRSFHHTRFVRSLREAALAEPNVRVVWTSARRLLSAGEYRESAEGRKAPVSYASSSDADRVVGVVYGDESGADRTVVARVTVAANGMFSNMRKDLHETTPVKVSHFCGLVLHHPAAQSPLPFPNRGHVVMIDPNPVLFYQISPTDTRVLVDVPVADYDKGPKLYFETVVAPQLPESLRQPFLDALATQRIFSMPCMAISGVPPKKKG
jgi:2-polyprenyl-6-methoxyphenol hydroxylase-like FAD-dependent oxidoreductase